MRDVFHILLAQGDGLGVCPLVVALFRKAEARLGRGRDHMSRIFVIRFAAEPKERLRAILLQRRKQRRQVLRTGKRINAIERRLQPVEAGFLDRLRVHAGRVVVADLLRIRIALRLRIARLLEHRLQHQVVVLRELNVDAVGRAVRRDGVALQPGAAGVLKKVDTWVDRRVAKRRIQSVQLDTGLLADGRLGVKGDGRGKAGGNSNHSGERAHCEKALPF